MKIQKASARTFQRIAIEDRIARSPVGAFLSLIPTEVFGKGRCVSFFSLVFTHFFQLKPFFLQWIYVFTAKVSRLGLHKRNLEEFTERLQIFRTAQTPAKPLWNEEVLNFLLFLLQPCTTEKLKTPLIKNCGYEVRLQIKAVLVRCSIQLMLLESCAERLNLPNCLLSSFTEHKWTNPESRDQFSQNCPRESKGERFPPILKLLWARKPKFSLISELWRHVAIQHFAREPQKKKTRSFLSNFLFKVNFKFISPNLNSVLVFRHRAADKMFPPCSNILRKTESLPKSRVRTKTRQDKKNYERIFCLISQR